MLADELGGEMFHIHLKNLFAAIALFFPYAGAYAVNFLPGFSEETIVSGLNQAIAFDFAPYHNSIFIASKDGYVWVVKDGELLDEPFVNLADEVNNARDRGLLGIAVHPYFHDKPFVYLLYTYDPPELANMTGRAGLDGQGNRVARLIRLRAARRHDFTRAHGVDPSREYRLVKRKSVKVILGKNSTFENIGDPAGDRYTLLPSCQDHGKPVRDCLPVDETSHTVGTVRFAKDGSLFVSNGDGAGFTGVFKTALRSQDLDSLAGKILRIKPGNGKAYRNNPFFDGDKNSNRSKVYNYGLRNPFRFTLDLETQRPFIGDVGWNRWEEINSGRGSNFGWPCYEGSQIEPRYAELPECISLIESGKPVEHPIFAYPHLPGTPTSVQAGDFYWGHRYPTKFQGALFYHDFNRKFIRYLTFNDKGEVESDNEFAEDVNGITQLRLGPDGNLYYIDFFGGRLVRINYGDGSIEENHDYLSEESENDD